MKNDRSLSTHPIAPPKARKPRTAKAGHPDPVVVPDQFERHEGFRETTLAYFTDPDANATLRQLGELMYLMVLEYWRYWPAEAAGSFFPQQARAGVADLRHLQGFFAHLDGERQASVLTPAEERISRLCGRLSGRVRAIADTLERELDQQQQG